MSNSLEQFGKCRERWNGISFNPEVTEFFIYENDGSFTAIAWTPRSYFSEPFDYYPSCEEVEDFFKGVEKFCSYVRGNEAGCPFCATNIMMVDGLCAGCYGAA